MANGLAGFGKGLTQLAMMLAEAPLARRDRELRERESAADIGYKRALTEQGRAQEERLRKKDQEELLAQALMGTDPELQIPESSPIVQQTRGTPFEHLLTETKEGSGLVPTEAPNLAPQLYGSDRTYSRSPAYSERIVIEGMKNPYRMGQLENSINRTNIYGQYVNNQNEYQKALARIADLRAQHQLAQQSGDTRTALAIASMITQQQSHLDNLQLQLYREQQDPLAALTGQPQPQVPQFTPIDIVSLVNALKGNPTQTPEAAPPAQGGGPPFEQMIGDIAKQAGSWRAVLSDAEVMNELDPVQKRYVRRKAVEERMQR